MMNIVLVTGGTKGIGKAIVLKYLHQGCYAIITYSSDDETAELFQRELDVNYKDKYEIIKADLSKIEEVKIMCNIIRCKYRKIDYLILNAGATNRNSFSDMTIDEWNYVINVNLTMPFFIVQSLVDCIIKGGSILFIGAVMSCALFVTYCFYFSRNTVVHNLSLLFTAAKIEKSGNKCISEADFCQVRETAYLR